MQARLEQACRCVFIKESCVDLRCDTGGNILKGKLKSNLKIPIKHVFQPNISKELRHTEIRPRNSQLSNTFEFQKIRITKNIYL